MEKCKRCGTKTILSPQEIEQMVQQVTKMKGIRLVPEQEYQRRFAVCTACEKFEYGSTCTLCGCVMQVRARLADGRCPYPKGGRWSLEGIKHD